MNDEAGRKALTVQLTHRLDDDWAAARDWMEKCWDAGVDELIRRLMATMEPDDEAEQVRCLRELFAGLSDDELMNVRNLLNTALTETMQRMREQRTATPALEEQWGGESSDEEPNAE